MLQNMRVQSKSVQVQTVQKLRNTKTTSLSAHKKSLNLFLIIALIFSVLPISVFANVTDDKTDLTVLSSSAGDNFVFKEGVISDENTSGKLQSDKPHIVLIHGGRTEDRIFMNSAAENEHIVPHMRVSVLEGGSVTGGMDAIMNFDFSDADVIIIHNMALDLVWGFENKIEHVPKKNIIFTTAFDPEHWINKGYTVDKKAAEYLDYRIEENYINVLLYTAAEYAGVSVTPGPVKAKPVYGIYHPEAGKDRNGDYFFKSASDYMVWYSQKEFFNKTGPMVAVLLDSFKSLSTDGPSRDGPMIDGLIKLYEKNGANVIFATYSAYDDHNLDYLTENGTTVPDAIVVIGRGARLPANRTVNETVIDGVSDLKKLNVVALNAVRIFDKSMKPSDWNDSMGGVPAKEVPYLSMAEMDGLIEPVVIIAKEKSPELEMDQNVLIPDQAEWFVRRTIGRANLNPKHTPNTDKKIAIPYYAGEAGKANLGADTDYYLNAPQSLVNLFKNMSDRGYNVGSGLYISSEELASMMTEFGHNVGTWAPGTVQKMADSGHVALIPEAEYKEWFYGNALDDKKRREVIELWGEAPGNIMVYEDIRNNKYIVIPKLEFGNIILSPNPLRGRDQTEAAQAHKGAFAPTHQCLAYYYYFNNVVNVDAYLPFYSNIAVMPGKETTLSSRDWGAILMDDKPIVHILPIDAKGVMDSRRANMQIISYMTPALAPAGLSESMAEARETILEFKNGDQNSSGLKKNAVSAIKKNGLGAAIGVSDEDLNAAGIQEFSEICDRILKHLYDTETVLIPYGTHTLGEAPKLEDIKLMVQEMRKRDDTLSEAVFTEKIYESASREIPALLEALDGMYIQAGLSGDPVQKPEILPAGRSLYTHDARTIPTKEAWEKGIKMADTSIEQYKEKYGKYPEKMSYLLWAIETGRNNGVLESEIFYLMGVKPVWNDTNGRIVGFYDMNSGTVVSGNVPSTEAENGTKTANAFSESDKLTRPRIDVLVVTSGSYRDMYSSLLLNISAAAAYASGVDDTSAGYENFVLKNTEKLKQQLIEKGYSQEQADLWSKDRIFAPPPGEYTSGIENFVNRQDMTKESMAQYYIDRMGYSYSRADSWGSYDPSAFSMNLKDIDLTAFSRSSNLFGVLDHVMVASYYGGLSLAADYANGDKQAPDMLIHNLRKDGEVTTLSKFLNTDLNSRYLNEKWIESMKENGYVGTTFMNEFSEALKLWDSATDGVVTESMWSGVYEKYIDDPLMKEYMSSTNAYAYQSLIGNLLTSESAQNLPDSMREKLVSEFVESVVQSGITCCHHTCANPSFSDFIIGQMSVAGISPKTRHLYMDKIKEASIPYTLDFPEYFKTKKGNTQGYFPNGQPTPKPTESLSVPTAGLTETEGVKNNTSGVGHDQKTPQQPVKGFQLIEKTISNTTKSITDFLQNPSFSSSNLIVILGVVLIVGVIFYGYRKKNT